MGKASFLGALIHGDLDCAGGTFSNPDGTALGADRLTVKGRLRLHEHKAKQGDHPDKVTPCTIAGIASFINATVDGQCIMRMLGRPSYALHLNHARVGVLCDDTTGWPDPGNICLDGFRYDRLDERSVWDLKPRLDWLGLHHCAKGFNPQPYEQLAKVYREAGYECEAKDVLIAKHWRWWEHNRQHPPLSAQASGAPRCAYRIDRWRAWLFGKICAFGYKPVRAVVWWLMLWLATGVAVDWMAAEKWLVPGSGKAGTAGFVAPAYSFDLLTPILNLGCLSAWTPANSAAAYVLIVTASLGYLLVALFAASITGLIRK